MCPDDPPDRAALADLARRYELDPRPRAHLRSFGSASPATRVPRRRSRARPRCSSVTSPTRSSDSRSPRSARRRGSADLGSGAGLPGLVLAAALPASEVRTVETQQSKCAYIASLAAAAGLVNVRVVCSRAEEWAEGLGAHDLVVARALAPQPVVLEYAAPLLASGGHLVEWRGRRDEDEEARAQVAAARLGLEREEIRRGGAVRRRRGSPSARVREDRRRRPPSSRGGRGSRPGARSAGDGGGLERLRPTQSASPAIGRYLGPAGPRPSPPPLAWRV